MLIHTIAAPWEVPLNAAEHTLLYYFLVIAALGFVAGLLRTWVSRGEVGPRYRTAVIARLGVMSVALASYVFIIVQFDLGYDYAHGLWVPNSTAIFALTGRYMAWTVSVPLLVVELLAVCALLGSAARRTRAYAVLGAFLMIFTGYLGSVIIDNGESQPAQILWGSISSVFWIATIVILLRAVRKSMPTLTTESAALLKNAAAFLLGGWVLYPIVYTLQLFVVGGQWTTVEQIAFTIADLTVKIGFAGLIHRVAKLRTAEDVRAGIDVHPEAIWISSVKQSDAGLPVIVYLAPGAAVHEGRPKPAGDAAIAVDDESRPLSGPQDAQSSQYTIEDDPDYDR